MKRIVLSLLIVLGVFTGATAQKANMDARKLQLALFAISNLYVDSTSETKLVEDAIVGMLDKLDPHSNYMDPEETKEMTEPFEGNFDGIVCDELTYYNCTITGKLALYGKATFINCTFENDMANQYSIWTWGGTEVQFEGCTCNTKGQANM